MDVSFLFKAFYFGFFKDVTMLLEVDLNANPNL